jgi:hypothetical protein
LIELWQEVFPLEHLEEFLIDECPVLIGITRLCYEEKDGSVLSDYQFKSLLKGETFTRTPNKVKCVKYEMLLNELVNFKEECDENEQALVSFLLFICGIFLYFKEDKQAVQRNIKRSIDISLFLF